MGDEKSCFVTGCVLSFLIGVSVAGGMVFLIVSHIRKKEQGSN